MGVCDTYLPRVMSAWDTALSAGKRVPTTQLAADLSAIDGQGHRRPHASKGFREPRERHNRTTRTEEIMVAIIIALQTSPATKLPKARSR